MESLRYLLLIIYILKCASDDLRTKKISLIFSLAFGCMGLAISIYLKRSLPDIFFSLIPSALMLVMSVITRGGLGTGDVIFVFVLALYLSPADIFKAVSVSWILCSFFSLVIIVTGRSGRSEKARTLIRNGLPYTAFMLPYAAYIFFRLLRTLNGS